MKELNFSFVLFSLFSQFFICFSLFIFLPVAPVVFLSCLSHSRWLDPCLSHSRWLDQVVICYFDRKYKDWCYVCHNLPVSIPSIISSYFQSVCFATFMSSFFFHLLSSSLGMLPSPKSSIFFLSKSKSTFKVWLCLQVCLSFSPTEQTEKYVA